MNESFCLVLQSPLAIYDSVLRTPPVPTDISYRHVAYCSVLSSLTLTVIESRTTYSYVFLERYESQKVEIWFEMLLLLCIQTKVNNLWSMVISMLKQRFET